ncbi:telomerase inhibitor [Parahypoxylon ruwenzoriense]
MGLAGPRNRRKLDYDPNNTKWSRDETTFGQRILRAQGWEPGKFLGVQNSSHSHLHTAASSAPIKVLLKDDTLGLGAKPRQKQSAECTGLDGFKDLLGRLNGKSEEAIEKEQQVRLEIKTSLYVERRYGSMRFVSGGFLVGDQIKDLTSTTTKARVPQETNDENSAATSPEDSATRSAKKQKKEKKSKKRKAEESDDSTDGPDSGREKKRKKRSKSEDSPESPTDNLDAEESGKKKKKSKKSKRDDVKGTEPLDPEKKEKKSKKLKNKSKRDLEHEDETDVAPTTPEDVKVEKVKSEKEKKEKKRRKEKKQKQTEISESSTEISTSTTTPQESGMSTPSGTGTSTPQAISVRHYARSRNIASKRMAIADLQALNQIFMVKPV